MVGFNRLLQIVYLIPIKFGFMGIMYAISAALPVPSVSHSKVICWSGPKDNPFTLASTYTTYNVLGSSQIWKTTFSVKIFKMLYSLSTRQIISLRFFPHFSDMLCWTLPTLYNHLHTIFSGHNRMQLYTRKWCHIRMVLQPHVSQGHQVFSMNLSPPWLYGVVELHIMNTLPLQSSHFHNLCHHDV